MVVPWDNLGGVCGVVNHVAAHLASRGHRVFYLHPGPFARPHQGLSRIGLPAFRLNRRPTSVPGSPVKSRIAFFIWLPFTLVTLALLIRRLHVNVVNIHCPNSSDIPFTILRRLGFFRILTSIHGSDILPFGTSSRQAGVSSLLSASDLVVAPSDAFQVAACSIWPELRHRTVLTIPNGIDPGELGNPVKGAPAAADPPYVLSILQLVPYKGVDVLIRAFARIAPVFPDLRLKLVSDGPNRSEYEALARSLALDHRIEFLGIVDRAGIATLLRSCMMFVLPSRSNSESFGIAAAEAMALDRPVIVSRIGGLPSLVQDEVSGLLVEPGDDDALAVAMRRLMTDPSLRQRLGEHAGERVRREFLWNRTETLYEDTLLRLAS